MSCILTCSKGEKIKVGPFRKEGNIYWIQWTVKRLRIYISGFRQNEVSRDVTFDEDASFTKSRKIFADEDHEEEKEAPRATKDIIPPIRDNEEDPIQEDHDLFEL